MTRPTLRITGWHWVGLLASSVVLMLSGGAWLALHYGVGNGELPDPLEAWLLRLHGLAAFAGLFMLGVLAAAHVPHGWRHSARHRHAVQRGTGIALCALAAALALSGYLLYYFAPETVRPALGLAHALAGAVMAVLAPWHARRKSRPV